MKCFILVILVLCPLPVPGFLGYKLDLLIHLSLRKGGTLPPQTGEYIQDIFRQELECIQPLAHYRNVDQVIDWVHCQYSTNLEDQASREKAGWGNKAKGPSMKTHLN